MFTPTPKFNKYTQHPNVLDRMASDISRWAMEQLRDDTPKGKTRETWIQVCSSWAIHLDNKPEDYRSRITGFTSYGMYYKDYGMQDVPEDDGNDFLDALYPYVEKYCKAIVSRYFPNEFVFVNRETYYSLRKDDDHDLFPAIKIHVTNSSSEDSYSSPYKSW